MAGADPELPEPELPEPELPEDDELDFESPDDEPSDFKDLVVRKLGTIYRRQVDLLHGEEARLLRRRKLRAAKRIRMSARGAFTGAGAGLGLGFVASRFLKASSRARFATSQTSPQVAPSRGITPPAQPVPAAPRPTTAQTIGGAPVHAR